MAKDYQLKVSITVPLTGLLGVTPPRIDRQIALGRELFPLDLCCLVCRRSDIL